MLAASLLTGVTQADISEPRPQYGGEYRAPLSVEPVTLDPAYYTDIYSMSVAANLFDGLVTFDQKLNVAAAIARRWKISRDHLSYEFQLRKGVTFHNGREVTAEDFVFSFSRILAPGAKSPAASFLLNIEGAKQYQEGKNQTVSGLTALDPYTLKIKLEKPFAPFLSILAMVNTPVVPKESVGSDFGHNPVGTGPFRFQTWKAGEEIVLAANENYFAGRPYVDSLRFRIYLDDNWDRIFSDFQQGLLDHARIPKEHYELLATGIDDGPGFKVVSRPGLNIVYIGMNLAVSPLNDLRVRHALNYAVDTVSIVNNITKRGAIPATGILPPGVAGFSPDLLGYGYDPAKARDLLAAAGYPEGRGFPPIELWTASKAKSVQDELKEYQRYFAAVGLDVSIKTAENWKAFVSAIKEKKATLFYAAWYADYPDPDNFFYPLSYSTSSTNRMGFSDLRVDQLLDRARTETGYVKRTELYQKISELVMLSAPTINQHNNSNNYLFGSWVNGEKLSPLGIIYFPFRSAWIDLPQRQQRAGTVAYDNDVSVHQ